VVFGSEDQGACAGMHAIDADQQISKAVTRG
jgi:hypothetical protein